LVVAFCLSWLQSLKKRSLRQTRGGSAVPIDGLLLNLGYSIEQHADGTLKISAIAGGTERQSVPPPLDAPCKGYQPPVGCTINYNDGYMCNMWCGGILAICHCVI